MIINHIRKYEPAYTPGVIFKNGKKFCNSLEDVGRPSGVKIPKVTCIPEGVYTCKVTYSNRFKKDMILLFNNDDFCVHGDNIIWSGVRVHGGTTIVDTDGCVLAGYKKGNGVIWERASDDLCEMIKDEKEVLWIISSIRG